MSAPDPAFPYGPVWRAAWGEPPAELDPRDGQIEGLKALIEESVARLNDAMKALQFSREQLLEEKNQSNHWRESFNRAFTETKALRLKVKDLEDAAIKAAIPPETHEERYERLFGFKPQDAQEADRRHAADRSSK
jgi:hypothetical protein